MIASRDPVHVDKKNDDIEMFGTSRYNLIIVRSVNYGRKN